MAYSQAEVGRLPITETSIKVGEQAFPFLETADFPGTDGWSRFKRNIIGTLDRNKEFDDRNVLESGIGDGRNIFEEGIMARANQIIGVEIDGQRLELARRNLASLSLNGRLSLYESPIEEWLQSSDTRLTGWGLTCLPQAPPNATQNSADGYLYSNSVALFRDLRLGDHSVDEYGLTLNTAYLAYLRERIDPRDFDVLITLSDRVPSSVLDELFSITGWGVVRKFEERYIQQDPDTGIGWVANYDDGRRFWQRNGDGDYTPISAKIAEQRREESLRAGSKAREVLNVYHGLSEYHLRANERAH